MLLSRSDVPAFDRRRIAPIFILGDCCANTNSGARMGADVPFDGTLLPRLSNVAGSAVANYFRANLHLEFRGNLISRN